ncbi:hypothetical protein GGR54DRAFT_97244 [Hypoxylon sp. NC1633]|nr:hypothetical protein GGR54DRAFT_97244 [Hypoxylon sp. NC1633]
MAPFPIGFYTITILAASKIILIVFELLFNRINPKAIFLIRFGVASAFLALVLGCVSFAGLRARGPDEFGQCESADADIVGDGVRAAAWTQVAILFFITLTGIFHCYKTAVKEIGGGLIVTHVSLAVALLVPLARNELSPIDAVLGALILDAQGNSLSIQLVTKETLAARWQVAIVLVAQLLGLVIEGVLVGSFTTNLLPTQSCRCFSVFWWAWLSNCQSVSPNNIEPYWIYFGYRFINIIYGSYFAMTRAETFSDAQKWDRENPCDPCDKCRGNEREPNVFCKCHPCTRCEYCRVCKRRARCHPHQPVVPVQNPGNSAIVLSNFNICRDCYRCRLCGHSDLDSDGYSTLLFGERFSEASVTVSANFLENSVLALLSMVSVEVTMRINTVDKTSPLYSVGQVTALIIAGGTAIRALWVFLYMFDARTHSAY